jgi:Transcriptional regulator containing PAS, AAA-type ATPase, and DNA-binding domains
VIQKRGLFEEARGGTLFLDEIGELATALQAKLLRALQDKEIRRLGDTKTIQVDARIIAATSRNLAQSVKNGGFREDLFYRLNVLPIHILPLRDRKEDIPHLVDRFIHKYNKKLNRHVKRTTEGVMSELVEYEWPGNVRELENAIERAMILTDSDLIQRVDLGPKESGFAGNFRFDSLSLEEAYKILEREFIERALSRSGRNRKKAAELLGLSLRSLFYKLKQYGYSE